MRQVGRCDCLLAPGLSADEIRIGPEWVLVLARMPGGEARCPPCGSMSGHIHSRYQRRLSDLPAPGRRVHVELLVRRFRCPIRRCPVQIFAERPGDGIAQRYGRRTTRLQGPCPLSWSRPWRAASTGAGESATSVGKQGYLAAQYPKRLAAKGRPRHHRASSE